VSDALEPGAHGEMRIGSRVGSYEITAKLGEGGMGEVFRARDTKLDRDVAIKVLPAAFTEDAERLARFEREAKLLAQLQHSSIAAIYGMEDSGSARALVMELVEGPTLADRLAEGPLALEESLAIARQVAEALEEAHAKGIIHRDLKPQNVKAPAGGKVKVLDFGLAKAMDPAASSSGGPVTASPTLMNSPTLTAAGTQLGVILGTAAYMSPEQAKGLAVDERADVWAFGVTLYEMLVGGSLFAGETVGDTLAAVIRKDVDLEQLPESTPPALRRLVRRCLERNPRNRLHSIADARIVLEEVLAGRDPEPAGAPELAAPRAPRRVRALAVALLLLALGAAGGWLLRRGGAPETAAESRWMLALPEGLRLSTDDRPQLALSRDGRLQVAVVVDESGVSQLLVRSSDEFEPHLLRGAEGGTSPFFSPDGDWIAFFRDAALVKVPVGGGPTIELTKLAAGSRGGTWGSDGWIYFSGGWAAPLSRVAETGGEVEEVTRLDETRRERTHRWPEALPGGETVLFTCDTAGSTEYYDDARIEAVVPSTGERRVLVEGASQARYAPGGHLVFARGGSLYAVGFDPRSLEVRGAPVEVARGVATNVGSGAVQFALSGTGAAIWAPGGVTASYRVVWIDGAGVESPVDVPSAPYNELALSPDGTRLALIGGPGATSDLWIADLVRGGLTRLTNGEFVYAPTWTPDGRTIAYAVVPESRSGGFRVDWRQADGSRAAETLVAPAQGLQRVPNAFTPDGGVLLYSEGGTEDQTNLWMLPLDGERDARALIQDPFATNAGNVSPDGRWLAYCSDESGQFNVYVRPFPEGDGRWQISSPGGVEPHWSPDGRELYYRSDSVLYRVAVDTANGFSAGRPEPFLDRVASGGSVHSYSLAPDGSRVVTLRTAEGSGAQRVLHLDLGFAHRLDAAGGERR